MPFPSPSHKDLWAMAKELLTPQAVQALLTATAHSFQRLPGPCDREIECHKHEGKALMASPHTSGSTEK